MPEEFLPKPNLELPKPELEIPARTESAPPPIIDGEVKGNKLKYILIALIAILVLGVVTAGAFVLGKNSNTSTPTPTPDAVACTMEAKLCPDGVTYVGRSGPKCEFEACPATATKSGKFELNKTYSSPDSWQIDYPGSFKLETRESQQMGPNGIGTPVVISYLGPTQGSGTEFHDGVSFSIGVQKKPAGQSIKDALDEYSKPNPENGGSRTELKPITINSLSGFETTGEGLGTFRFIMLNYPGDNTKAYLMTIFADGPEPNGEQYKTTAEEMIQSFRNI